ncbi:MAG: UDP-N-acetylmuramoyl-tripeptide--D-alanyl-D-alanine ligase [Firmicutes bacterium HGW-Firmicutes-14]|nr:MAG: UDP-N-acetylmuramoyl-tripeptide--D-alanyl-D-alanine ligase [Firmicutes bacterium HGW-Firmicutes-14]
MKAFTVREITEAVSGKLIQGNPAAVLNRVSTDTRQINRGDLFFALAGERFDAHDFIDRAMAEEAGGLVVSRRVETGSWQGPVVLVEDTLKALQALAGNNRKHFTGPVIGVTGSNGKTTTKDMISSVLERKYKTLKTPGNLNNEIGLPLTLLELNHDYGAAVLEMGMRAPGEIDLLAAIALPTGAVITNIGETHLERLGSVENIARAKGEILDHIDEHGFAVLNGDDRLARGQAARCRGKVVYYGLGGDVEISARGLSSLGEKGMSFTAVTPVGDVKINLPVPGRHNVINALAAVGVGIKTGVPLEEIKEGLESTRLTSMRLEIIETGRATVINDSYNANPASVKAALQILDDLGRERRKIAILGDMFELGRRAAEGHREVGEEAAARKVDILVTVGTLAREIALGAGMAESPPAEIISFNSRSEAVSMLDKLVRQGDVVLVKGSRGMKMEEITRSLEELT